MFPNRRHPLLLLMLWVAVACCPLAPRLRADDNLVKNPNFTQGDDGLKHWQAQYPEPNETKYGENHTRVSVVDAPLDHPGKAARLDSTPAVAGSQGVKLSSEMMELTPDTNYEFGCDLYRAQGTAAIVFLEGYEVDKDRTDKGSDAYAGYVRIWRKALQVKSGNGKWDTVSQVADFKKLKEKKRPAPTHVLVKLYCYYPTGQVYYTKVFLRPVE